MKIRGHHIAYWLAWVLVFIVLSGLFAKLSAPITGGTPVGPILSLVVTLLLMRKFTGNKVLAGEKGVMGDAQDRKVFLSYHRADSSFMARSIFQSLKESGYEVFMDVAEISAGRFKDEILSEIGRHLYFLVILTPDSVKSFAPSDSWMRLEIESAMDLDRQIVPILADGFTFDGESKQYLTGKLSTLGSYNALEMPHHLFDEFMVTLKERFLRIQSEFHAPPPKRGSAYLEGIVINSWEQFHHSWTGSMHGKDWRHVAVKTYSGDSVSIRLHKDHFNTVAVGDRIRFKYEGRENKTVKDLVILSSNF